MQTVKRDIHVLEEWIWMAHQCDLLHNGPICCKHVFLFTLLESHSCILESVYVFILWKYNVKELLTGRTRKKHKHHFSEVVREAQETMSKEFYLFISAVSGLTHGWCKKLVFCCFLGQTVVSIKVFKCSSFMLLMLTRSVQQLCIPSLLFMLYSLSHFFLSLSPPPPRVSLSC